MFYRIENYEQNNSQLNRNNIKLNNNEFNNIISKTENIKGPKSKSVK